MKFEREKLIREALKKGEVIIQYDGCLIPASLAIQGITVQDVLLVTRKIQEAKKHKTKKKLSVDDWLKKNGGKSCS